jgi:hypothetical protein
VTVSAWRRTAVLHSGRGKWTNALRCQSTTVSGFRMRSQRRQPGQKRDKQIH